MRCTICGNEVVLIPSAEQRAKKFGGKPSDYTRLFTAHNTCQLKKRAQESSALMRRIAHECK